MDARCPTRFIDCRYDALAKARAAVDQTIEHLESTLRDEVWEAGKHPEIPESKVLDNPYMYTDYVGD